VYLYPLPVCLWVLGFSSSGLCNIACSFINGYQGKRQGSNLYQETTICLLSSQAHDTSPGPNTVNMIEISERDLPFLIARSDESLYTLSFDL
jgi:hypothetical protein